jgi:hypothetical protein
MYDKARFVFKNAINKTSCEFIFYYSDIRLLRFGATDAFPESLSIASAQF